MSAVKKFLVCCSELVSNYTVSVTQFIRSLLSEQIYSLVLNFYFRYVAGSLVFGVLYDKFNKLLLLTVCTIGLAVFHGVQPWCTIFPGLLVVRVFGGAFAGGLDTGKNKFEL